MTFLDRLFLVIIAVVLLGAATLLSATILGNDLILYWLTSSSIVFDGGVIALILILLAVYLLILVSRRETGKFLVYPGELGAVRIGADCVESLVVEAASQIEGFKDIKASISNVEDPKVVLKLQVYPDNNIPELSEELQNKVKSYVESTLGITLSEIEVRVVGISERKKAEVEEEIA